MNIEKQRTDEILFCCFLRELAGAYDNSVVIFDLIETFGYFAGANITLLKNIVAKIYNKDMGIVPSKVEQLVLLKKADYSFRDIFKMTGIHSNTQYRMMRDLRKDPKQIPTIRSRLTEEEYDSVKKFMDCVKAFKEII